MADKVTLADIQQALTPEYIRVSQIIHISIIMGATFFLLVIVFMYMSGSGTDAAVEESVGILNRFSMIHAALFLSGMMISGYLFNWMLRQDRIESMMGGVRRGVNTGAASGYLAVIRTATIIRIAIIEAPVFFGLVTCFMAVNNRAIVQYPWYWANVFSYVVFIVILIREFPTKDKLLELIKDKLGYLLLY